MAKKSEGRIYSLEEYFRRELKSLERHEYFCGRLRRLSGSPPEHALITANAIAAVGSAKSVYHEPDILVYAGDLLIQVRPLIHYTYADFTVVCGKTKTEKLFGFEVLTNPALVVEVISELNTDYDLGTKFQLYKAIESFHDYLLIDSRQLKVLHYRKLDNNTWIEKTYWDREGLINLENLQVELKLTDIYEHINF